jgi:rod shape-determining protein MreB and related proteins
LKNSFIKRAIKFFGGKNRLFGSDVGIDLGTVNTLVYVTGEGIVINEPTVVAVNQKTNRVVAIGLAAENMLGRTPGHISAIRPLVGGVISDFEIAEEMLSYLLGQVSKGKKKFFGPRVLIGVPSGVTNVESRAVRDIARGSGAREVHVVEEPMAAAIGIKLPINDPVGNMVVDIGGGTTDIAVISLGGIVRSKNLKIAGNRLNADIAAYVRSEFKVLIGEKTAEAAKIAIGTVLPPETSMEFLIRGRDLISGLPREVSVTDTDIREAMAPSIELIIDAVKETVETTPPEIIADVMHHGLYLVGGGALIRGLPELLEDMIRTPVYVADDPLTAVARGAGRILEQFDEFESVLLSDDEISTA